MENRTLKAFSNEDITQIADTYHSWRGTKTSAGQKYADVSGFCRSATTAEIADHSFTLTPGRYVGSEAAEIDHEPLDEKIARLSAEIRDGIKLRDELQTTVLAALDTLAVADE